MEAAAKLITAFAALLGALAWPGTLLALVLLFRRELRSALGGMPGLIGRIRKASVSGLTLELDRIADAADDPETAETGAVTPAQVEAAARIKVSTEGVDREPLVRELDKLTLEYDSLRRTLPSGARRTQAMTRLVVKMRSLAPSLVDLRSLYMASGSAGGRLAAIAMMQMRPDLADFEWLVDRFRRDEPFLFYHAALAMQAAANLPNVEAVKVRAAATEALGIVIAFDGDSDPNTITVLQSLV